MKSILKILILTLFLNCSNSVTNFPFEYHLGNEKQNSYIMEIVIGDTKVSQEIEFIYNSNSNDSIKFDAFIRKINWEDDSLTDEDNNTNDEYYRNHIIDKPLEFKISNKGRILEPLTKKSSGNVATDFFDVNMFFIPYADNKTNSKWEIERDIRDIVFKTMKTTFKVKSINKGIAHVKFESKYLPEETMFSKQNKGSYFVDISTGLVLEAKIKISGFNGMQNSNSIVKIKKKD